MENILKDDAAVDFDLKEESKYPKEEKKQPAERPWYRERGDGRGRGADSRGWFGNRGGVCYYSRGGGGNDGEFEVVRGNRGRG